MMDVVSARLFAGLGKDEVSEILAATFEKRFKASETIIRAESPAAHLILVKKGSVNLFVETEQGQRVLLRRLVPGNALGIAAFLSEPIGYLGTATAVRDVEILSWDRRDVRRLARAYPRLAENALRIALHYIAFYAERHVRLVSNTAQERLACALTGFASRSGHVLPSGIQVDIKNQDLASLADVSFFTATRLIKKWERAGAVQKSRGKVTIRCPEKLLAADRVYKARLTH